jgi:hypothetical protein
MKIYKEKLDKELMLKAAELAKKGAEMEAAAKL